MRQWDTVSTGESWGKRDDLLLRVHGFDALRRVLYRYYNGMEGLGKDPGPDETDGFDMRKSMPRDTVRTCGSSSSWPLPHNLSLLPGS